MRPSGSPFGISWCRMPLPAVIHCTSPAPIRPRFPRLSPCSTVPASTYVIVSIPRCGCQGNPARYASGLSLRKSSSSRNGSKSLVAPNPNARRSATPAPSMVGTDCRTSLTGRMDMIASLEPYDAEVRLNGSARSAAGDARFLSDAAAHDQRDAVFEPGRHHLFLMHVVFAQGDDFPFVDLFGGGNQRSVDGDLELLDSCIENRIL